VTSTTVYGLVV